VTIDIDSLTEEYCKAMGWDGKTRIPTDKTLEKLNLRGLVDDYG
jgi:hypothetical protein